MVYKDPFAQELTNINTGLQPAPVVAPTTSPNPAITGVPAPITDTRTFISSTPKAGYIQGYDTTQGYAPVYVPRGQYVAGISATGKDLTTDKLADTSGYILPNGQPGTQAQADQAMAAAKAYSDEQAKIKADQQAKDLADNPPPTALETQMQSLLNSQTENAQSGVTSLNDQQTGLNALNSSETATQLDDINSQLQQNLAKSAALDLAYQNANLKSEGSNFNLGRLAGEQSQNYRQYTIEKNNLAAETLILQGASLGLQGKYDRAKSLITEAFDSKVKVLEAQQKVWEAQVAQILPSLTREENARLEEVKAKKAKELSDATDLKTARTKAISDLYAAGVAVDSTTSLALNSAKDVSEVDSIMTKYAPQLAEKGLLANQIDKAQLAKLNADIRKINIENQEAGTPKIINPNANKYSAALSVILGSGKFTKDQKASVVNAINNGEDPFVVIKNQAKNIAGQTEATKITNYEVAASQLDDISTLLDTYYELGGKTNIFKGNYEKTINKLGEVSDPKLVSVATQISSALQIYRNAISGTAYSVQEGKDIAAIFPGINKSQGLNEAILNGRKAAFNSTIDGSYRSILGKTYDELKTSEQKIETPAVIPPAQIPTGYYQASDGLLYKK